ncbi:MAG: carboxymuconolactone decarboxylase family protein [Pseudomonadales bacterium]
MANVDPLTPEQVPQLAEILARSSAAMGFVPNSMLTMAHLPQLTAAFSMLAGVTFGADLQALLPPAAVLQESARGPAAPLPRALVQLVAFACSVGAGCRYCQAHTSHGAHRLGEDQAKLDGILGYESNDAYSEPERAALALAFAAAAVPNETTPAHFERLREHFSEPEIVQLVAVVALFGFLNRWNDTMATQLEAAPLDFAEGALGGIGWDSGKHGG